MACIVHRIGRADWQDDETIHNNAIEKFMSRVTLSMGPHPDSQKIRIKEPSANMSSVEVVAKGKVFKEEGKYIKLASSLASSHVTPEDLVRKFAVNASKAISKEKVNKAIESLLNLEKLGSVSDLIKLVSVENS